MLKCESSGQGSSQQIGSDADDLTPKASDASSRDTSWSQPRGSGWQRQAPRNQRFIIPRPDCPTASSSDRNQLDRSPLHAMNQPVFEELEVERCITSPDHVERRLTCRLSHDQASTGADRGPTLPGRTALPSFLPPYTRLPACCHAPFRFFVRQCEEKW